MDNEGDTHVSRDIHDQVTFTVATTYSAHAYLVVWDPPAVEDSAW
jgi:hypothetical protein